MPSKKPARKTSKRSNRRKKAEPILSSAQKRGIAAVVFSMVALLLAFAVFDFGGSLATSMLHYLRLAFGYAAYLLPVIFGLLAYMLFRTDAYQVRAHNYLGFAGFIVSLAALFHVGIASADASTSAQDGLGGGYLGFLSAGVLLNILNVAASTVVLLALLLIFMIVATGADFGSMLGWIPNLLRRTPKDGKEGSPAIAAVAPDGDGFRVIDNSGTSTLPVRGELNLGAKPTLTKTPVKDEPQEALTADADTEWTPPALELLSSASSKADAGNVKGNSDIIKSTMDSFGINVTMGPAQIGPTVTQYSFTPPAGVKLSRITTLDTNLALSLATPGVRIEAPIPGKSAVGVEIANKSIATVRLRSLLESPEWGAESAPLTFILGKDVSGTPIVSNLAKAPHMLIAGATGSGKSAMINSFLTSLLYRNSPSQLKLILVDPKQVELGLYNDIPHLLTPVITKPEQTISALKWAVSEMERRYSRLAEVGNRNIEEYNKAHKEDAMPYIVVVIDEMADLMIVAAKDVESLIVRLAQMARAIGIHLVLATQRPSVDVITGVIKANVPTRLAFSVASQIDSRTILDQMGAEKLLGKGDMLFASADMMKPRRIQGAFLEESEVKAVTDYLRTQKPDNFSYNDEVLAMKVTIGGKSGGGDTGGGDVDDELFEQAAEAVIRAGKASTSMLQRRLRVGYARAARLIDLLEEQGIVGPADGARPRDVLVSSMDQVRGAGSAARSDIEAAEMRQAEGYDD